jgi:hypothetical protein
VGTGRERQDTQTDMVELGEPQDLGRLRLSRSALAEHESVAPGRLADRLMDVTSRPG